MEKGFLNEYFPASVFIRKRYDILNFKQKEGQPLGDSYKRFKRILVACPTHNMDKTEQMQVFVNGLRMKTKQLINTAAGGSTNFTTASGIIKIIEAIAANEHLELYDRCASKPEGIIDLKLETSKTRVEDAIAAEVEKKLKAMNIGKQQVAQVQQAQPVNCEISNGPHQTVYCFATPKQIEEIKFLRQNNPYSNTYNPGWKNHPNFAWKDQQQQGTEKAEWEVAIERLVGQCSQFQEETRNNHRNTSASIKNLEVQVGQIAQHLTLQAQGTLPSSTVVNPKNQEKINVVTTRSPKAPELEEEEEIDDNLVIEVDLEIRENPKEPEVVISPVKPLEEKNKKETKPVVKLPFPSRVAKKDSKEKDFEKFAAMFKKLEINLPFFEALENMPLYKKFMKEVISKKKQVGDETKIVTEKCGRVSPARKIPIKKKDPGVVAIPCTINDRVFKKVLIDSGSSVSLMPLSIFKKLEIGKISESETKLQFADHTIKNSYGIAEDVVVEIDKFVYPVDFHIMDIPEDEETPILLGRPFLLTSRCNLDIEKGELVVKSFDEEVTLKVLEVKKEAAGRNNQSKVGMIRSEGATKSPHHPEKVSSIISKVASTHTPIKIPAVIQEIKKKKTVESKGEKMKVGSNLKRKVVHTSRLHKFVVTEVTSNQVWRRKYPP